MSDHAMRVFIAAIDAGGFSAAAERLGMTPSGISKTIARLEDELGVRLINRTTRRLGLTPEGATFLTGARDILGQIEELHQSVGSASTSPRGLLRINTGTAFGHYQLMPRLAQFLDAYPDINLAVELTDRRIDLIADEADVVIRTGPPGEGSLMVRKITEFRRMIAAAPSYLERYGAPETPADLARHMCLILSDAPSLSRWPFTGPDGPEFVQVAGRVTAGSAEALRQLALQGVGIIRLGDVLIGDAVADGRLVQLFADRHVVEAQPISAVYPMGRHRSPKVRVFVDWLVETFGREQRSWHE